MNRYIYFMLTAGVAATLFLVSGCTVVHSSPDGETITTEPGKITMTPHGDLIPRPAQKPLADNSPLPGNDRKEADEAARELASLRKQLDIIHTEITQAMKDRSIAVESRDKVNAEAKTLQQNAGAFGEQVQQLAATKAAMEKETLALAARREEGRAQMGVIDRKVVEREQQVVALNKQHAANRAAVAASQATLDRVVQETKTATARLNELQPLIGERQRQLAELARQKKPSEALPSAVPATQPANQPMASSITPPPPAAMSGAPTTPSSSWMVPWRFILAGAAAAGLIALLAIFRASQSHDHIVRFDSISGEEPEPLSFTLGRDDGLSLNGGSMSCEPVELIDGAFIRSDRRGRVKLFSQPGGNIAHNGLAAQGVLTLAVGDRLDAEVDGQRKSYVSRHGHVEKAIFFNDWTSRGTLIERV